MTNNYAQLRIEARRDAGFNLLIQMRKQMKAPFHYEPIPQEIKADWEAMKEKEQEVREELQRIMGDRFSACGYTENKESEK